MAAEALAHLPPFKVSGCMLAPNYGGGQELAHCMPSCLHMCMPVLLLLQVRLKSLAFFEHSSSYTLWMDAADSSGTVLAINQSTSACPAF